MPEGFRNLTPHLTLSYNTGNGDSPFGYGWQISTHGIQVDTDIGIADYSNPKFLMAGETLIDMGNGNYRPLVENAFQRIRRIGDGWEITDKNGTQSLLGSHPDSRIWQKDERQSYIFAWLIDAVRDTSGNEIRYYYLRDGNNLYLSRIQYAAFEIRLFYEDRHDATINRRPGFAVAQRLRCNRIEIHRSNSSDHLIRRYSLTYSDDLAIPSLLTRVSMEGFKRQSDGSIERTASPSIDFFYSKFDPSIRTYQSIGDDSLDPPGVLGEGGRIIVDMHGDGLPDIVELGQTRNRIWRNLGNGRLSPPKPLSSRSFPVILDAQSLLFDADGSGTADLVVLERSHARYYPNLGNGHFDNPRFLGGRRPLWFNLDDSDTGLADIDGDGRVDLVKTTARGLVTWRNLGGDEGFETPRIVSHSSSKESVPNIRLSDPNVFIADMTGDGLPDIVHVRSGLVEYWPSLGSGRYDNRHVMKKPPQLPAHLDPKRIFLADVDGTGTNDIIYVDYKQVLIWRNLGGLCFANPIKISGTPFTGSSSIRLVDFLGKGTAGILWTDVRTRKRSSYRYLSLTEHKPFLLNRVRTETGLETQIEYASSSQHALSDTERGEEWTTQLPIPVPVINRFTQRDLVSGAKDSVQINYHEGYWDPQARRFRGFGRVTVRRVGGVDSHETYMEHRYLVGSPKEPAFQIETETHDLQVNHAKRGQLYYSAYYSNGPDSSIIRTEETRWQIETIAHGLNDISIFFPKVTETEVRNFEGNDHPRVVTCNYDYDAFGNIVRERRTGHAPKGDDNGNPMNALVSITKVFYACNIERYVVDRVARIVREDDSGSVLGEVRHYYDGQEMKGLPLGEVDAGLLSRQELIVMTADEAKELYGTHEPDWIELGYHETIRVDGVLALAVNQARYAHSTHGLITKRVDSLGSTTSFVYEAFDPLVVQSINALGHISTASYDRGFQLIEKRTDPNGCTTSYIYDGLGRIRSVIRPGDSEQYPTIQYIYDHSNLPTSIHILQRKTHDTDDVCEQVVYYDGFHRKLQTRVRIEDERVRVGGELGRSQSGDPIFKGQSQYRTGLAFEEPSLFPETPRYYYKYDGMGRLIWSKDPINRISEVSYTPWTARYSDVTDGASSSPPNNERIEYFDTFGRLVGAMRIGDTGIAYRANYKYDLLGRLVSSTDQEGRPAFRQIVYDGRGLKLCIDHAAAGKRMATYNAAGWLVGYWDERNEVVERSHDVIGRILTESINGVVQETYHYDQDPQQLGMLGKVDDNAGSVIFNYDMRGNISKKCRVIHGITYEIEYDYDPAGNISQIRYPNGNTAIFNRYGDGNVREVPDFVDTIEYSETARITRLCHSNGVEESFTYDTRENLRSIQFTNGTEAFFSAQLERDSAGRLVHWEERNGTSLQRETFTYNSLNQLVQFRRINESKTSEWKYIYDADGNLLRADEMGAEQYQYDFDSAGQPFNRLMQDGTLESVTFDVAGHLMSMPGMTFKFNARGHLTNIMKEDGTVMEMTYDYRGARVAKKVRDSSGEFEVRYVDDLYEDRAGTQSSYVFVAGRLIGYFRGGGRRHLHVDYRGSVIAVTRPNGKIDGRGWFGPYGRSEGLADPGSAFQYTGAVSDQETGLYYLNHRYYSPDLGRFLSPDPFYITQAESSIDIPESLNLFAYAISNPISYIDPTGQNIISEAWGWAKGAASDAVSAAKWVGRNIIAPAIVIGATIFAVGVAVYILGAALPFALLGAGIGALAGGLSGGSWEGAAIGAMMGATIGINYGVGGPLGIITFLGVSHSIRSKGWYKGLAGWSSWFMPASWPGHILGFGVFLANGLASVCGSDRPIERIHIDWEHGQIQTIGGQYFGTPYPGLTHEAPAHNAGGFSFFRDEGRFEKSAGHETGHMLSNALFGSWQGIVQAFQQLLSKDPKEDHNTWLFERIAESNAASPGYGNEFWTPPPPPPPDLTVIIDENPARRPRIIVDGREIW